MLRSNRRQVNSHIPRPQNVAQHLIGVKTMTTKTELIKRIRKLWRDTNYSSKIDLNQLTAKQLKEIWQHEMDGILRGNGCL